MNATSVAAALAVLTCLPASAQLAQTEEAALWELARSAQESSRQRNCHEWSGTNYASAGPATLDEASIRRLPDKGLKLELMKFTDDARDRGVPLSRGLLMLVAIEDLDAQVNNGGFSQYFWNGYGKNAHLALEGLRLIGAETRAGLLEKALKLHAAEKEKIRPLKERGSLEAFSEVYAVSQLGALDSAYYRDESCLGELVTRAVRANPALFAVR